MPSQAKDRADAAARFSEQLGGKILPYWYDKSLDTNNGGYLLADDAAKVVEPATTKQLVTQARMVWGFSHAWRKGFRDTHRDYLAAAESGYKFLQDHFRDVKNGGYYWTTDVKGNPTNRRKILYGEAFVIYAFVEYHRATGALTPLAQAMSLYRTLQDKAHDAKNGGWYEHFEDNWTPIMDRDANIEVEVGGFKSANAHLHLMEALTELYDVTRDPDVKKSLEEALRLNATYFYPMDASKSCFHRQPDWKEVTDPRSAGLSYGHNVEFAWLMIRAQSVLDAPLSWDHFDAHVQHALQYGYDHMRGGLYSRGTGNQTATDRDKVWWVQAEMLAALTDGLLHKNNRDYRRAMDKLVDFIFKYQAYPPNGIWMDTVTEDGRHKGTALAHNWKANYHDVRAIIKFIDAFGEGR